MLVVQYEAAKLVGLKTARIFRRGEAPFEIEPGTVVDGTLGG